MDAHSLQAFFRLGVFITLCSLIMTLLQPRDSAEFVVSVCSTMIGGTMILIALIVLRLTR